MSDQQQSGQQSEQTPEQTGMPPSLSEPSLSEFEANKAREQALERASQSHPGELIAGAHGRVEEETRRLSEQMTHEEQERRRAVALSKTAPLIPPTLTPTLAPVAKRQLPAPMPIHMTLVTLDGTSFSERAIPYAAALAHLTGSAITLGTCAHRSGHADNPEDDIELVSEKDIALNSSEQELRKSLLAGRDRLATEGIAARANVIYAPDATDGLLFLGQRIGADALALATHARGGIGRAVLGSVADELVRQGRGLALVIPPLAPDASRDGVIFERALAPLDGSALSEQSLRAIQPLLQRDPMRGDGQRWLRALTLFFIADDPAQVRDAEIYLHELRETLQSQATAPTEITAQVVVGSAPGAIVAQAAGATVAPSSHAAPYDLLIMATHGRGGAGRWFYGSVATYVLAHSGIPVLLMRASL